MTLERGQFVRLTYGGETVKAMVILASPNGKSLMFSFDGALSGGESEGIYFGSMPVLQDDDGVYRDLVLGEVVTIEQEIKPC